MIEWWVEADNIEGDERYAAADIMLVYSYALEMMVQMLHNYADG